MNNTNNNIFDVIIIGAGAAGLSAAIFAARKGSRVAIFERNERAGKKLNITGKGRCNLTNNCDNDELLKNIPTNPRFLYSALWAFSAQNTMEFFEGLGVKLKTERGKRVFPESDKASEIVNALKDECSRLNVEILYNCLVSGIETSDNNVTGVKLESGEIYNCNRVILATGGASYTVTGSDGLGYKIAKKLGHTIVKPKAALVPIETKEKWINDLMGLSLKNVTLTVCEDNDIETKKKNKQVFSQMGEMLFTHFGLSGPLVLSASSFINAEKKYKIIIDFKPALDVKTLDARILREIEKSPNKDFANLIRTMLPAKAVSVFVKLSGVPFELKANQLTKEQRQNFISLLKGFELNFAMFRPLDEAIITSGGISVKEINPKTMESKLVNGLFFAGEIIDVDAFTGGFNLQIAFSTAFTAASGVTSID